MNKDKIINKIVDMQEQLSKSNGDIWFYKKGFRWNDSDKTNWFGSAYKEVVLDFIKHLLKDENGRVPI